MAGWRLANTKLVIATLVALAPGCEGRHATDPVVARAGTITAAEIRSLVSAIADDSMRGRLTPGPALDELASYAIALFQAAGLGPGLPTGFRQTFNAAGAQSPNVVAVLPGSDPLLRAEHVVFVAHMDGIGTAAGGIGCSAAGADSICNGADDNASGTAAVLALARAFGGLTPRPRRSLLFLLVSGEEWGLVGSEYYVAHPSVPLAQTVAAINFDMISRNAPDSLLVIGADLSTLGPLVAATAQAHPELGLRTAALPWPYGGSDHIPFGSAGVPTLAFFTGLHADYHRPSDEVARTDPDKEARIVRLAFYAALAIANAAERPAWTGPPPGASVARGPAAAGPPR